MDTKQLANMDNTELVKYLRSLGACDEAVSWVAKHGGTPPELWRDCERGDWMAWLLGRLGLFGSPQDLAVCMADILEPTSGLLPAAEDAQETLRLYAMGIATIEDVKAAARDANAAGWAANAAGWAANAAGWAANAAGLEVDAAGLEVDAAGLGVYATNAAGQIAGWAANAAGLAVDATIRARASEAAGWVAMAAGLVAMAAGWVAVAAGLEVMAKEDAFKESAAIFRKHYSVFG